MAPRMPMFFMAFSLCMTRRITSLWNKGSGWALGEPVLPRVGGPQAAKAEMLQRTLPVQKFLLCQLIAFAGFGQTKQSAAHRGHDLRFLARHPTPGIGGRQIF